MRLLGDAGRAHGIPTVTEVLDRSSLIFTPLDNEPLADSVNHLLVVGFYVVFNFVVPRVLLATSTLQNRELPVLFAVVGALGSIFDDVVVVREVEI